jgi:hypothetical protein
MSHTLRMLLVGLLVVGCGVAGREAAACPFCSAVSLTFSQEIAQSDAAVIARLVEPPAPGSLLPRAEGPLPKGKFTVVEVLKGGAAVDAAGLLGPDAKPLETILLEEKPVGTLFLLMAVEPPKLVWSSPILVSDRAVGYIRRLGTLPEKGPDRLAFFQQHLEDEDDTLARDAYDEFAVSPYADVKGLKDRMDPAQLLAWIENPKVQANRRRLYATMLGVCGTPEAAERIGRILEGADLGPDNAEVRSGLDALIACYITLRGQAGLDLVDRLFLERTGKDIPFAETYAAVMALRFLGEESDIVPRDRVLASLRLLLDEPKLADLVVADLARWQDWSVVGRLVGIFKDATADNIFVREPIVNYLRACPLPEAAAAITELEKIDPEAVRRAATLAGLAGLALPAGGAAPPPTAAGAAATTASTATVATAPAGDQGQPSSLAARIAPVIADEDGGEPPAPGAVATVEHSGPSPALSPRNERPAAWKWALWAVVVLLVAVLARLFLRPGGRADVAAR